MTACVSTRAVQEKEALVRAMAKELGELEQAKDGQVREANREVRASTIAVARRRGRLVLLCKGLVSGLEQDWAAWLLKTPQSGGE